MQAWKMDKMKIDVTLPSGMHEKFVIPDGNRDDMIKFLSRLENDLDDLDYKELVTTEIDENKASQLRDFYQKV